MRLHLLTRHGSRRPSVKGGSNGVQVHLAGADLVPEAVNRFERLVEAADALDIKARLFQRRVGVGVGYPTRERLNVTSQSLDLAGAFPDPLAQAVDPLAILVRHLIATSCGPSPCRRGPPPTGGHFQVAAWGSPVLGLIRLRLL